MKIEVLRTEYLRIKKYLFFIVVIILSYLLSSNFSKVYNVVAQQPIAVILAISLNAATLALQAHSFLLLLPVQLTRPAFHKTYQAWASANLTNYLGPLQPGLAVRAAFFKIHNIPIKLTLLVTFRQLAISMWLALGFSIIGLLSENHLIQTLAMASIVLFTITPLVVHLLKHIELPNLFKQLADGFTPNLIQLSLIAGQYLISAANIYLIYSFFGANLELHDAILLSVIFALSSLLSLTPNNLGVQETILAYAAHLGGLSSVDAISIALTFRLGHIIACFIILITIYALQLSILKSTT